MSRIQGSIQIATVLKVVSSNQPEKQEGKSGGMKNFVPSNCHLRVSVVRGRWEKMGDVPLPEFNDWVASPIKLHRKFDDLVNIE